MSDKPLCKSCEGVGSVPTGIEESPEASCRRCDGDGYEPAPSPAMNAASQSDEPFRVAEFWSSANPGKKVRMLAEGVDIEQWGERGDFIRWVDQGSATSGEAAVRPWLERRTESESGWANQVGYMEAEINDWRAVVEEIAGISNLTATPAQFAAHLQRIAARALDQRAALAAKAEQARLTEKQIQVINLAAATFDALSIAGADDLRSIINAEPVVKAEQANTPQGHEAFQRAPHSIALAAHIRALAAMGVKAGTAGAARQGGNTCDLTDYSTRLIYSNGARNLAAPVAERAAPSEEWNAAIEAAAALFDSSPHAEEFRVNIAESIRALKSLATPAPTAGESVAMHAYKLADNLYSRGYTDRQKELDYDPRAGKEWQAVVDAMDAKGGEA